MQIKIAQTSHGHEVHVLNYINWQKTACVSIFDKWKFITLGIEQEEWARWKLWIRHILRARAAQEKENQIYIVNTEATTEAMASRSVSSYVRLALEIWDACAVSTYHQIDLFILFYFFIYVF